MMGAWFCDRSKTENPFAGTNVAIYESEPWGMMANRIDRIMRVLVVVG